MLLKINEYEIFVKFTHDRSIGKTDCQISIGQENYPVGTSHCSSKDNFCYAKGRKLALIRATQLNLNREQRKEFWKAYWAKRKEQTGKDWAV